MSAWIVSERHITVLVDIALSLAKYHQLGDYALPYDGDESAIGQMLWQENHNSVNARYNESTECPVYEHAEDFGALGFDDAHGLLKQIDCYEYQSCEHDGWESSESYRLCEAMSSALELMGADRESEAYASAPWGIDDDK